jgi:peptidoglycan/xylan/chitin deacetylase (PgdA/CDA1 family)
MRSHAIMYHDVITGKDWDASGFPGHDAARYKLDREAFSQHLDAILRAGADAQFLTFDDGGISAYDPVAGMLEERGWRGHFFITTGRIGSPGFLSRTQIAELHRRGHVLGSHSSTHPERMSHCTVAQLQNEWRDSIDALEDIISDAVTVASVPGGFYSRAVGEIAEQAGIRMLFTSEPTNAVSRVGRCMLIGRYAIRRGMPPVMSAAFAEGRFLPCFRQSSGWKLKKVVKLIAPDTYLNVRGFFIRQ